MRGSHIVGVLGAFACMGAALAQIRSADAMWTIVESMPVEAERGEAWIRPSFFSPVALDTALARDILAGAPLEFTQDAFERPMLIELPRPDGSFARFEVIESPIMEPDLAARFPQIRTYAGVGLTDPAETVRFDLTPSGFHAQVLGPGGSWFIDPYTRGDTTHHTSYWKRDLAPGADAAFSCFFDEPAQPQLELRGAADRVANGATLRQFRLAVAANVEYSNFHGGTVQLAQAAIVTAMNRVNGVYERDLSVRMNLVANNNLIVFTSEPDGYTNNNPGQMLGANTGIINTFIGSANYDIGHVFSTGGGGVAGLGVVCGASKGAGVTGLPSPTGDAFYIDFVAHEMGHQFNSNHCFNGTNGNCSGANRNGSTAYEPGSGSTIMAYAGICGNDNLQNNSDDYFHSVSLDEIAAFVSSGNGSLCDAATATGNSIPTVEAGPNFTIPISTPFELTATASDANPDTLTYCWEQRNLSAAQGATGSPLNFPDTGANPIIRSFDPSTSPTRVIPRIANLLTNTFAKGEVLPTTSRTMTFRCTVRDNRAGGGAINDDSMTVTSTTSSGPFVVTAPNAFAVLAGPTTVTWNVAGTTGAPVSCANVKILLSTDGGNTFPTTLLASTPNDGSQLVTLPAVSTSTARIKVAAVGNIFFDISNANFQILPASLPGPFNLSSPANGATDIPLEPTLQWTASTDADNYTLEVDTDAGFAPPLVYSVVTVATSAVIPPATLLEGTTYFWRVTAMNENGNTASNPSPASFITVPPPCTGDANGDGIVDFEDITTILLNWLNSYPPGSEGLGDADNDGDVDFDDFTRVLNNWLDICP